MAQSRAANVTVNVSSNLAVVPATGYGIHTSVYANIFGDPTLPENLIQGGVNVLRYPGGGYADVFHWSASRPALGGGNGYGLSPWWGETSNYGYMGADTDFGGFLNILTNAQCQALITVNFGAGLKWSTSGHTSLTIPTTNAEPPEAAAWVAYSNASTNIYGTTNDVMLGTDSQGNNWNTAGYWAMLRAASPLAIDDGYNFLRINRTAPIGIQYWEIGNETFGTGYYDSGGDDGYCLNYAVPYPYSTYPRYGNTNLSPAAYGRTLKSFSLLMKAVDPTIKIGAVSSTPPDDYSWDSYNGQHWTPQVLAQCATNIDFVIAHSYPYNGNLDDGSALLPIPASLYPAMINGTSPHTGDNAGLRDEIAEYRADATNVQIFITEFGYSGSLTNEINGEPVLGPVNTLFAADSYATWLELGVANVDYLELSSDTFLGDSSPLTPGAVGYAVQLTHAMAGSGDTLVNATSDTSALRVHAAVQSGGNVKVMLLNESRTNSLAVNISIPTKATLASSATQIQFGVNNFSGGSNIPLTPPTTNTVAVSNNALSVTLPPYTMDVLIFNATTETAPAGVFLANSVLQVARAYHTTTPLQNGKLLVAGGYNGSAPIATTELYDPTTGGTVTNGALGTARWQHTATLLPNGKVLVAGGQVAASVPTNSAELFDPVSGKWTFTGSMNTARFYHTATLLTNGLVLAAGGETGNGVVTNSAELYNPVTGTWSLTGPMTEGRYADTATLLTDGTVLATGGLTPGITPTTELYNPVSGTWSATGLLNFDRWGHVATRLPNGQVLAAGGAFLGDIPSCELYNPATKTWTVTGSLNALHVYDTATLLPDGKVLAVSGYYNSSAQLTTNATEFYDSIAGTWKYGPLVNAGRAFHTATLLPGGQVVLVGGTSGTNYLSSIETFEETNGGWTTVSDMSAQRYIPTLTLLTNGQALAAGGMSDTNAPANTEVYNPATGNWTTTPGAMSAGRFVAASTVLANGQVLITGGFSSSSYLASAEVFNPATGFWTLTPNPMNVPRGSHTATLLDNGKVLVAGGLNTSTNSLVTAEIYDPVAGTWTLTSSLVSPRSEHTATLLPNGQVLVAGGYHVAVLSETETYNPLSGTWTTNNPMTNPRIAHTATLLPNGKVLVAGGYDGRSILISAELFNPATGSWIQTGPMNFPRRYHTATLLPSGQVLVAGGDDGGPALTSSEVYDPELGGWLLVNPLNNARSRGAATLLPNGQTLMIGGYTGTNFNDLASAEVFDPGLGFSAGWQPQISGLTSPLTLTGSLVVNGAQFRGISEASGGNASQDSPADYPLVQLMSLGNNESRFVNVTNWTTNGLTTAAVTNFPAGPALATVFANGIQSQSAIVEVQQATATITLSNLLQFFDNSGISVSVTTVPPGLPVYVTYNGSTTLPTNVGSYAVVATISDPDYQGTATNILQIEGRNFGVDVSHFQNSNGIPQTNWAQMVAQGTTFAFVKATEGLTGANDPTMATNVARATQAGLLVGVYHFAHPENRPTTNGAVQEATNFLIYAGSAIGPGMLRPVLDIETGAGVLSAAQMTDWVLAFSQEVVNSRGGGAVPIIYCLQSYASTNFDSRLAGNALWIYATGGGNPAFSNPPTNGFPSPTGIFTNWAFWQYNISGSDGGISPIDLDVCHDDFQPVSSYLIPVLTGKIEIQSAKVTSGGLQLSLTNIPGTHFAVLATTNASVPLKNWPVIGAATEISPGQYQFIDSQSMNFPQRFYQVRWPQ